jgi:hypothetical protein
VAEGLEVFQAHQKQVIRAVQAVVDIVVEQGVQEHLDKATLVQPQLLVPFCKVGVVEQVQQVKVGQHHNQHQSNIQEQTEEQEQHPQLLVHL